MGFKSHRREEEVEGFLLDQLMGAEGRLYKVTAAWEVIMAIAIILIERNGSTIIPQVRHQNLDHGDGDAVSGDTRDQNGNSKAGGAVVQSYMCASVHDASPVRYGGQYLLCHHIYWRM